MIGHSCDNGRCGGGSAGSEDRYHFPAVDCAHFDDATTGKVSTSPHHGEMPERIAASKINTIDGPPRGTTAGKQLAHDRGGF